MVETPLVHPDGFFRARGAPSFLSPAGIVVAWSVVFAPVGIIYEEVLFPEIWEELATDPEFADLIPNETAADPMMGVEDLPGIWGEPWFWYALDLVIVVIFALGLRLAVAGVLYLVSGLFTDTGQFGRLLLLTGWGFLPVLLYMLVIPGELLSVIVIPGPGAYWDTWLLTDFTYPYLSLGVALWVGYIWVYAVKHARGVPLGQAIATTSIPIGGCLLFELWFWFV